MAYWWASQAYQMATCSSWRNGWLLLCHWSSQMLHWQQWIYSIVCLSIMNSLPTKVRTDHGGESIEVWRMMLDEHNKRDKCVIARSSTHNEYIHWEIMAWCTPICCCVSVMGICLDQKNTINATSQVLGQHVLLLSCVLQTEGNCAQQTKDSTASSNTALIVAV